MIYAQAYRVCCAYSPAEGITAGAGFGSRSSNWIVQLLVIDGTFLIDAREGERATFLAYEIFIASALPFCLSGCQLNKLNNLKFDKPAAVELKVRIE